MGEASTPGLSASDLWLARDGREVLGGVSLELPRGCVTAVLAPSGTGKSTVLRCMTRLLDPDRGLITLGGEDVQSLAPRELRRRVGLVAQTAVMFQGTVAENVAYGLPGGRAEPGVVDSALAAAGLDPAFATRAAGQLSGGEQARVAIARAVVLDSEMLLLDEPTAALDAATSESIGSTLRRLADGGLGVALATHDTAFAERFVDRIVQLRPAPEQTA